MKGTIIEVTRNDLLSVHPDFGSSSHVEQTMTQDDDLTLHQEHLQYCAF